MRRYLTFILFVVIGCTSRSEKNSFRLGDFKMKSLDGKSLDMSSLEGKTVFINVWATWCKPCIQEMPTIAKAMEMIGDKNVVFLFASSEETSEITEFADRKSFPFKYVQLENLEALSIKAIPATFIFSPEGELDFGEEGFRDWSTEENMTLITKHLNP